MSREQINTAKKLILAKQYDEARRLLETMEGNQAVELLRRLDVLTQPPDEPLSRAENLVGAAGLAVVMTGITILFEMLDENMRRRIFRLDGALLSSNAIIFAGNLLLMLFFMASYGAKIKANNAHQRALATGVVSGMVVTILLSIIWGGIMIVSFGAGSGLL